MICQLKKRVARMMALLGCSACLVACEAVPTEEEPLNKDLVGKVSVGLKPLENRVLAEQAIEVLFYLSNGTDTAIEILPWGTPLESNMTADRFVVTAGDELIPYGGPMVKRAPPGPDDYVTLAAGEKLENVVVISDVYDVSAAGEYKIVLKPFTLQTQLSDFIEPVIAEDTLTVTRQ